MRGSRARRFRRGSGWDQEGCGVVGRGGRDSVWAYGRFAPFLRSIHVSWPSVPGSEVRYRSRGRRCAYDSRTTDRALYGSLTQDSPTSRWRDVCHNLRAR